MISWGVESAVPCELNIIGTSIRLNYYTLLIMVVLVEVELAVMAVVVDTLVEMDRSLMIMLVVGEDHSISIEMEQKHLDGSKMENLKLHL